MKRNLVFVGATFILVGCGGGGTSAPTTATLSGRVTDVDGNPVRGATVSTPEGSMVTSSNGTFVFYNQQARDQILSAVYTDSTGTVMRGQNLARARDYSLSASINIAIAPENQLASITGVIEDKDGWRVQGARVFAFGGGMWSSSSALTDSSGRYTIRGLVAGTGYTVNASAPGYSADFANVTLNAGQQRTINMTLLDQGTPSLPQPQNVTAVAWTSVPITRGNTRELDAIEWVKKLYDPKHGKPAVTRSTPEGYPIEVELEWDPLQGNNFLGYGIYRSPGSITPTGIDYYREPLAGSYIDTDPQLAQFQTYNYQLTALGTGYPNDAGSEGVRSTKVSAQTLGAITLGSVSFRPLTFNWSAGSGSTTTYVYLFDQYPDPGTPSLLNPTLSTTGNSVTYSGAVLTPGHTYYYIVLGTANGTASRTVSEVGSFVYQN